MGLWFRGRVSYWCLSLSYEFEVEVGVGGALTQAQEKQGLQVEIFPIN